MLGLNFVTEMLLALLGDFLTDIYNKIGTVITDIYTYTVEINQTAEVAAVTTFSMLLGAGLAGFVVVKELISTYGMGTTGDSDQDPMEIIFRLCKALGMMGMNSWLFNEMLRFSNAVADDVVSAMNIANRESEVNNRMLSLLSNAYSSPTTAMCSVVIVVGLILFGIAASLRGAELTLNKILLPIFALDIIKSNPEKWNMFIFQYGISFFSYILQMFCFNMYILIYLQMDVFNMDFKMFLVLVAWLVLSIKTPSWLEKYIYATGTGRAVSQGASRIGQVVMMVGMRM